mgnify:CR=1 FL=1
MLGSGVPFSRRYFLYTGGFHSLRKVSNLMVLLHLCDPFPLRSPRLQLNTHWNEPANGVNAAHFSFAFDSLFCSALQKGHANTYPIPSLNIFSLYLYGKRYGLIFSIYLSWIVMLPKSKQQHLFVSCACWYYTQLSFLRQYSVCVCCVDKLS